MADDLCLLFQSIAFEWPTRLQAIGIAAEWMTAQDQVPAPAGLGLPDVGHLVDEMPLQLQIGSGEIVAVVFGRRVKVQMPHRRHGHPARLQREPAAAANADAGAVNRCAKNRLDQRHFAAGQRPFTADRAGMTRASLVQLECSE